MNYSYLDPCIWFHERYLITFIFLLYFTALENLFVIFCLTIPTFPFKLCEHGKREKLNSSDNYN